ncbi:MAG: IreB family regulatory phosphoprotein [Eubacteriaceae bacterium]|nr:IreB family regulatory phosphoprotein [Eubacteriaceae bacterium]
MDNKYETETQDTVKFDIETERSILITQTMSNVKKALKEKGYNPVNQIVGYIMSGDPTYITSHNDARSQIKRLDRDELLEEIVSYYLVQKTVND